MDFYSPKKIKEVFFENDMHFSKGLGQNFLVSKDVVRKLVDLSSLGKDDFVLEIGPGLGAITNELVNRTKEVLAVEKDARLAGLVEKHLEVDNLKVINQDVLDFDEKDLKEYSVVSNLPFSVSTHVIRKFLESNNPPKKMIVITQKEVALRMRASVPRMTILSVAIQFYADVKILFTISRGNFFPRPKIESSVVEITPREKIKTDEKKFFELVRAGFSSPRKKAFNNIASGLGFNKKKLKEIFDKLNIDTGRRAETFTIEEWVSINNLLS
jgi:16S rRNA (adenine1518-N6/adenine1519-N6)-dimethyltransferase